MQHVLLSSDDSCCFLAAGSSDFSRAGSDSTLRFRERVTHPTARGAAGNDAAAEAGGCVLVVGVIGGASFISEVLLLLLLCLNSLSRESFTIASSITESPRSIVSGEDGDDITELTEVSSEASSVVSCALR